jgi:hypothetical protein
MERDSGWDLYLSYGREANMLKKQEGALPLRSDEILMSPKESEDYWESATFHG